MRRIRGKGAEKEWFYPIPSFFSFSQLCLGAFCLKPILPPAMNIFLSDLPAFLCVWSFTAYFFALLVFWNSFLYQSVQIFYCSHSLQTWWYHVANGQKSDISFKMRTSIMVDNCAMNSEKDFSTPPLPPFQAMRNASNFHSGS